MGKASDSARLHPIVDVMYTTSPISKSLALINQTVFAPATESLANEDLLFRFVTVLIADAVSTENREVVHGY
jgi:hypothetical protein